MSFKLWTVLTCLLLLAGFGLHSFAAWVLVLAACLALLAAALLLSPVGLAIMERLALIRFIGRGGN